MFERPYRRALLATAVLGLVAARPAAAQEPNFGRALAMTATELFVGQPVNWYGPGVVYTYQHDGRGAWDERAMLSASDSSRMDDFGRALGVDGNTLVVGAPRKREGSGVVYVFERASAAAEWRESAVLEPPPADDNREYGAALALSGDDLLVGAPAAGGSGVVHHFRRDGGSWSLERTIAPAPAENVRGFGETLAWRGDVLLVGAPTADSARGRVYEVRRRADGSWSAATRVALPFAAVGPDARIGAAVLLDDGRAWVGVPGAATVYALERDGPGAWSVSATLAPPGDPRGTRFGFALATTGDELWVGAPGTDGANGRVHRFERDGPAGWRGPWSLEPDQTVGAPWPVGFGYAIAAAEGRAVVGMPTRDFGEGRVMALTGGAGAWEVRHLLEGRIYRIGGGLTPGERCESGLLGGEFTCANIEVVGHVPIDALGGERGAWVNDVWGWTDSESGRDYALVARRDGASFVDVTNPSAPRLVGDLPRTFGSPPSVWRDIKVIDDYAYIVADGARAHGMQVFDLARLRDVVEPVVFEPDTTYHEIFSAHNVAADTASKFLYIVGANSGGQTCGGGLHMVDATDPLRPAFAGCYHDPTGAGSRGYTHDAQCLVYQGPDERYRGRQICVGSNESEINIADVTDKQNPRTISRMSYPNVAYAHQGWFDDEQRYFYMNDELDELAGTVEGTRTIIWDLTELDDPIVANEYIGPVMASDHNLYVRDDRMYQSNYGSGLRVIDISDRENPHEIAFFDSAPYNDDEPGHSASQSGAWSNYPFFESGVVVFTSVREGLFIVRVTPPPVS